VTRRRSSTVRVLVAALALVVPTAACGDDGGGVDGTAGLGQGARLELVTMSDNAFTPNAFRAKVGERVTYRFVNVGTERHEAVLGDQARQDAHAEAMRQFESTSSTEPEPQGSAAPGRAGATGPGRSRPRVAHRAAAAHPGMTDPFAVLVEPGSSGEITITFDQPGQLILGCHEPGHWESGMHATIDITE